MNNKAMEFPHPVLNEYSKDFTESDFSLVVESQSDNSDSIVIKLSYLLNCPGLAEMINRGVAKVIARVTCFRTSYRKALNMADCVPTELVIPKHLIADTVEIQGMIVAADEFKNYQLSEFNEDYFANINFTLRKGDVIASEPGIRIKLDTVLEKDASGVVLVSADDNCMEMHVNYATVAETDERLSNYIVILLPAEQYKNYTKLRTKKYLKNGIERFLQASLILPAITEGISKLRAEELTDPEELDEIYSGTIWADSIKEALHKYGVDDLGTCPKSDFELANALLGNVESDSINNLMQKMIDWSTIRQEEDV